MKKGDRYLWPYGAAELPARHLEFVAVTHHPETFLFKCEEFVGLMGPADEGFVHFTAEQMKAFGLRIEQ